MPMSQLPRFVCIVGLVLLGAVHCTESGMPAVPPPKWEGLRDAAQKEWTVKYSWVQGRDELVPGRPDLRRHTREATLNHLGHFLIVKKTVDGFERERRLDETDRGLVLRNVLDLIEGYTLDAGRESDIRTSDVVTFQLNNKVTQIYLHRDKLPEGLKLLHSIGAK